MANTQCDRKGGKSVVLLRGTGSAQLLEGDGGVEGAESPFCPNQTSKLACTHSSKCALITLTGKSPLSVSGS